MKMKITKRARGGYANFSDNDIKYLGMDFRSSKKWKGKKLKSYADVASGSPHSTISA